MDDPGETLRQDGAGQPDGLDRLWTPHRMAYIRGENKPVDATSGECPFCRIPSLDDAAGLVVRRGEMAYAVLNLYPYSPGSSMAPDPRGRPWPRWGVGPPPGVGC